MMVKPPFAPPQELLSDWSQQFRLAPSELSRLFELFDRGYSAPFLARYCLEETGGATEKEVYQCIDLRERWQELLLMKAKLKESLDSNEPFCVFLQEKIESLDSLEALSAFDLSQDVKQRQWQQRACDWGFQKFIVSWLNAQPCGDFESLLREIAEFSETLDPYPSVDDQEQAVHSFLICHFLDQKDFITKLKEMFLKKTSLVSKMRTRYEKEKTPYESYAHFSAPIDQVKNHQYMALRRGHRLGFLKLDWVTETDELLKCFYQFYPGFSLRDQDLKSFLNDFLDSCLLASWLREVKLKMKREHFQKTIDSYSKILKAILLQPPLHASKVLAIDPARQKDSNCQLVLIDGQGKVLESFAFAGIGDKSLPTELKDLLQKEDPDVIAVGTAQGSQELMNVLMHSQKEKCFHGKLVFVSDIGASLYAASEESQKLDPDLDVLSRRTVTLGRRILDPLSELVKLDPRNLTIGRYQKDLPVPLVVEALHRVLVSAIHSVGVDLNRGNAKLLSFLSGLNLELAKKIVLWRKENGFFQSKSDLLKVDSFNAEILDKCIGFVKIFESSCLFDRTALLSLHKPILHRLALHFNCDIQELLGHQELHKVYSNDLAKDWNVNFSVMQFVLNELKSPFQDSRFFRLSLKSKFVSRNWEEIEIGDTLRGVVTHLRAFGAFVDVGLDHHGFIHVSDLDRGFVSRVDSYLKVGQVVSLRVKQIDVKEKKITFDLNKEGLSRRTPVNPVKKKKQRPSSFQGKNYSLDDLMNKFSNQKL